MGNKGNMEPIIFGLAGLLHDIGKFGQRADGQYNDSKYLSQETKDNIGYICKKNQGDWYSHQHVLWTKEFIEKNIDSFRNAGLLAEEETANNLANLASYHHVPTTREQGIITLADWWSSGLDRSNEAILARNPNWGKDKFRSMPLASCFPSLNVNGQTLEEKTFAYEIMKFCTSDKIFPKPSIQADNKPLYRDLWDKFNKDFQKLPSGNRYSFIYSLFHLLKLYTWYMPASTMDYPDISLFEHLKITGAFAHCLATYLNEYPDSSTEASNHRVTLNKGHYPVKLWCGDISGIQNFIYNITNKSAVKSLKGRSMYVQLLSESVSNEMLDAAGASIINTVYSAGGKFYVLLPNTQDVNDKLKTYLNQLEKELWEKFHGNLSINVASIAFTMEKSGSQLVVYMEDNPQEGISPGKIWKLLADKVTAQKRKRFNHLLVDNFDTIFCPTGNGGDVKACAVTGIEVEERPDNILSKEDVEQDNSNDMIYVSPQVKEQIELGKKLAGHKYLTVSHKKDDGVFKIGINSYWKVLKSFNQDTQYRERTWILTDWNDEIDFISGKEVEKITALGFRLYGGSNVATKTLEDGTEVNKSFEELANSQNNESFTRLAVLRMDIDNLGELFMKGFNRKGANEEEVNCSSFSALATLSTQLDVFFSGYVNHIRNMPRYRDNINIIYSGGDDLFAVGKWDKIIDFAEKIRADFRKFVCNREDISISGGITFVRPKFPIAKAADLAGEAEDIAKNSYIIERSQQIEKNAITLFEIPINWEKEWNFVKDCKTDMVKWIGDDTISKGVLMHLFTWYSQYKKDIPDWKWQSAYSLARQARNKEKPEQKFALNQIKNLIYTGQFESLSDHIYKNKSFEVFIAACRWAEFELRNLKK